MNVVLDKSIEIALEKGISYAEYMDLMLQLIKEGKSTSEEENEALSEYTKLNGSRMKRWNKVFKLSESQKEILSQIEKPVEWLVLTESWCGDAAHATPIMNTVAAASDKIDLKFVMRDQHLEFMDQFLTNGGRSIPKLVMIDKTSKEVLGTWGPRPEPATQLVNDFKEKHGGLTPEFKQDLQSWYNKDKGAAIAQELMALLPKI